MSHAKRQELPTAWGDLQIYVGHQNIFSFIVQQFTFCIIIYKCLNKLR